LADQPNNSASGLEIRPHVTITGTKIITKIKITGKILLISGEA
jgi:hypothetical protein